MAQQLLEGCREKGRLRLCEDRSQDETGSRAISAGTFVDSVGRSSSYFSRYLVSSGLSGLWDMTSLLMAVWRGGRR